MYYYNNCNIIILYIYIFIIYPKPANCQITYTYILPCYIRYKSYISSYRNQYFSFLKFSPLKIQDGRHFVGMPYLQYFHFLYISFSTHI